MNLTYQIDQQGGVTLISLEGKIMTKEDTLDMMNEVEFHIAKGEPKLVLNLEKLSHMNSSGLAVMINMLTKTRNAGGEVIVTAIPNKIKELLVITKLTSVFKIADTVQEGIASFEQSLQEN